MKERPILFSGAMVRALLAGTKTQTRRLNGFDVINAAPDRYDYVGIVSGPGATHAAFHDNRTGEQVLVRVPYGLPGDTLWVRETWQYADWTEDGEPYIGYSADGARILYEDIPDDWRSRLEEIWCMLSDPANFDIDWRAADRRWRPSIHLPRWACRLMREVTGVRVERLWDINERDVSAEGCRVEDRHTNGYCAGEFLPPYLRAWRDLWASINGAESWNANPWVWVIEFKRIDAQKVAA